MASKWYKVWTVGNGGIPSDKGFFEFPDYYEEEDISCELESALSPLPFSTRSINWEVIETLPDEAIDEKIKRAKAEIKYRKKLIKRLEKMRNA